MHIKVFLAKIFFKQKIYNFKHLLTINLKSKIMHNKTKFFLTFIIAALILTVSCEKNPMYPGSNEFFTGEYTNIGGVPQFKFLEKSKFLEYDSISVVTESGGDITVGLHGIIISGKNHNYEVTDIVISECQNGGGCSKGDFIVQSEFEASESSVKTDILAVLVIDVSSSLGNNVESIKVYAKYFASSLVANTDSSYVAVVMFSENIQVVSFGNKDSISSIHTAIDNYTDYASRTTLYGACQTGLDLLDSTKLEGIKTLIVFTDGTDNNTDNPSSVKSSIMASAYPRFTIGVGEVDYNKDELKDLASKTSNYVEAKDFSDLENAFEFIGKQVTTIYQVSYTRGSQEITDPIHIKFKFAIDKQKF